MIEEITKIAICIAAVGNAIKVIPWKKSWAAVKFCYKVSAKGYVLAFNASTKFYHYLLDHMARTVHRFIESIDETIQEINFMPFKKNPLLFF